MDIIPVDLIRIRSESFVLKARSLFCDQICVLSSDPLPVFSRINLQAVEPAFFTCNGVLGLVVPIPTFPPFKIVNKVG